jgi:hypothetical protein
MSSREWAAIVYGRSYYLDFRFITLPQNFTAQDISWASQHIIATTQQARNLAGSPRWSVFKNDSYCVLGVTCMVRDLIGQLSEDLIEVMTKDDQGRPLYVFVGYVTQLSQQENIQNNMAKFPPYGENHLTSFQDLYREIEPVWLVKNYEPASRKPLQSRYQAIGFARTAVATNDRQVPQLNHCSKHPDKIYLWPSLRQQNNLLWQTSIQTPQATSICLNIKGKPLANSLFLNQTASSLDSFQVKDRTSASKNNAALLSDNLDYQANSSLSQKISNRAKEDINLTIQQAAKVASASQELINNLNDWSNYGKSDSSQQPLDSGEIDNFGFKMKKPSSTSDSEQDWF